MMKRNIITLLSLVLLSSVALAQRVGYVDTGVVLEKIPEYGTAQEEVERISQQWQQELEEKYQAIEQMYSDYQAQEVLLPDDLKRQRQEEIFEAEREAKEYREKKFGYEGELFQLQEARVKPIQDKVFKAVEKAAKRKRYDFVFDKAGEVTWLYTNNTYDLTKEVLRDLGIEEEE